MISASNSQTLQDAELKLKCHHLIWKPHNEPEHYENSFAVIGPRLWNTIPHNITTKTNKDSFKVALSKYMDQIPDEPPIDGFTRHNSLLDYNRLQLSGGRSEADVDSWSAVKDDVGCYEQLKDGRHHRS